MLSFTGKNRKTSAGSIPKVDAAETAKEKAAFHISTKADPTKAIHEAQPCTFATDDSKKLRTLLNLRQQLEVPWRPPRSNPLGTLSTAMRMGTSSVRHVQSIDALSIF